MSRESHTNSYILNNQNSIFDTISVANSDIITTRWSCGICKSINNNKLVILDCQCILHIECIVESQLKDLASVDEEFIYNVKCNACNKCISLEDMCNVYSKYGNLGQEKLNLFTEKVGALENKMRTIREEMKVCFDYKFKLLVAKEKSNQIASLLQTLV